MVKIILLRTLAVSVSVRLSGYVAGSGFSYGADI
jgi:hypothetical protein